MSVLINITNGGSSPLGSLAVGLARAHQNGEAVKVSRLSLSRNLTQLPWIRTSRLGRPAAALRLHLAGKGEGLGVRLQPRKVDVDEAEAVERRAAREGDVHLAALEGAAERELRAREQGGGEPL